MRYGALLIAIASAFAFPSAVAADSPSGWTLQYRKSDAQNLVPACLYRDKAAAGMFSRGDWRATLEPEVGQACEMLAADMRNKTLYLAVPGFNRVGEYLNGRADAYGCHSMSDLMHRYSICNSEFFREDPSFGTSMRKLKDDEVRNAIRDAKLVLLLDQRATAMQAESEAAARAAQDAEHRRYFADAEAARTLETIAAFEKKYSGRDPDGLMPQVLARRPALELRQYRDAFAAAKDAPSLRAFVAQYASWDPDGLLEKARRKLEAVEKRDADRARTADTVKTLADLESQIRWCRRESALATEAIARERKIASVSGYENKVVLRRVGELIISCDDAITTNFARYQKLGGRKTLDALK